MPDPDVEGMDPGREGSDVRRMAGILVAAGFGVFLALLWYNFLTFLVSTLVGARWPTDSMGLIFLAFLVVVFTVLLFGAFLVLARWVERTPLFARKPL